VKRIVLSLVSAALLLSPAVMAGGGIEDTIPELNITVNDNNGPIYEFKWNTHQPKKSFDPNPSATPGLVPGHGSRSGPMSADNPVSGVRGSVTGLPAGGAMMSPKQRAKRDVQRLIRQLG